MKTLSETLNEKGIMSFADFLNEKPLHEAVTFKNDSNVIILHTIAEFIKWFSNPTQRNAYSADGNWAFTYNRMNKSFYAINTSQYGKSGNTIQYNVVFEDYDAYKLINDLTDFNDIIPTFEKFEKEGETVKGIYKRDIKNLSADAFNPIMLKNFKSAGSIASKDKVTKAQARKIVASGDFKMITHDYQMRDDNYSSDGKLDMNYTLLRDILGDLDAKNTSIMKRKDTESFIIYVHSNLSYTIVR